MNEVRPVLSATEL